MSVGGGPAGQAAADAYREAGGGGSVTILAREPDPPYERPPLTKDFLRGESGCEALPLVDAGWYRERGIDLRTGAEPIVPPVAGADGPAVGPTMESADPRLLAAGDVAFAFNKAAGRRLRVEHWGEALNMGAVAGATMAGEEAAWDVAPGFWSEIGNRTLKYVGWGDGHEDLRFEPGEEGGFACWYVRDGELVGVVSHLDDAAYERGRELIEERAPWS